MSPSPTPKVFVCGATGSQGGAVAQQLLKMDWTVHTTVRNITSPAALSLAASGVQIIQGDWDNLSSLKIAMAGCTKLFLCSLPDFSDPGREKRQVSGIISVAKAVGVSQVILSTTLAVHALEEAQAHESVISDSFMMSHSTNKKALEDVEAAGFNHWTFLRPAFFMANFLEPKIARYPEPRDKGTWTTAMTPSTLLPLIDHVDIARFAVAAFQDPDKFHKRAVGLASELLTVEETLKRLGGAAGRAFTPVFLSDEEVRERQREEDTFVNFQVSMRYMSNYVDLNEIKEVIQPTSFIKFLEREKKLVKESYP